MKTRERTAKRIKIDRKVQPTGGIPALSSALGTRVGAIWFRNAPHQSKF